MTKASTPEGLLALCPNELAGNKKSAICNNANDTVITLLNYAWIRTKLDTYIDSITENFAIVNPFAEKEHVQCKIFYIHPLTFISDLLELPLVPFFRNEIFHCPIYEKTHSSEYTQKMHFTAFSVKMPYTTEASAPVRRGRHCNRPA